MRLQIDNWRWADVPFFIRAGKSMPVTVTEVRVVFKHHAGLGFARATRRARSRTRSSCASARSPARGSDQGEGRRRALRAVQLDMDLADGGEGPTPYEVLLDAAMRGDPTQFARKDAVEQTWRIVQPLIDSRAARRRLRAGHVGPAAAEASDKLPGARLRWRS